MSRGKTKRWTTKRRETWLQRNGKYFLVGGAAAAMLSLAGVAFASNQGTPESTFVVPQPTIMTPDPPTLPVEEGLPVVAFIGDSYTHGTGASDLGSTRWTTLVSNQLGWDEANLGRGGTGYFATSDRNGCGLDFCPNYQEMIPEALAVSPDIVVIAGGQNDFSEWRVNPASVTDAINATYTQLRAELPEVRIIAVGPSTTGTLGPLITAFDEAVQASAFAVGAEYVSLISPAVIEPSMITADGGHVNDFGHRSIANAVLDAINLAAA